MRAMPRLQDGPKQTIMTTTFLGYNHNEVIRDGEMFDMKNLSGDQYPLMTVRKPRASADFTALGNMTGINGRDQLTFVLGKRVFWNFSEVRGLQVDDDPETCPKRIVNFGAYVCIFPDKKYFNTINLSDFGTIDRPFSVDGTNVTLMMCRGDGTDYAQDEIYVNEDPPENPSNGKLWMDQSGNEDVLRQWNSTTEEWVEVPTTYVKISATGIGTGLNIYDGITISGLAADPQLADAKVAAQVEALNGSKIVYYGGEDYIVVAGLLSLTQQALAQGEVRADRSMPEMDWIVESNNRLWGCRYGLQDGQVVNEIYASSLGDFRNWRRYLGNSQDSYTASVGTDGAFTAAAVQNGYPVFFKENCIHQVYGNVPGNFQIRTTMCRGVQRGSGNSAVVVNEQIYYKSRTDVMMFDGSIPVSVGDQLGGVLYSEARAGALGGKYFISMKDREDNWVLFTYDTEKKVWYREDGFHALGFGRVEDELFAVGADDSLLWRISGSTDLPGEIEYEVEPEPETDEPEAEEAEEEEEQEEEEEEEEEPEQVTELITWETEEAIDWRAEFGLFGTDYKGKKYLARFDIRMYLEENTTAYMKIMYDSDGIWRNQGQIRGTHIRSFVLPVVPRRCDHLKVKLEGTGPMRIYSIARIMEDGADG